METPAHLGGHLNRTNSDEGALGFLTEKFRIHSFVDVGCGPGDMLRIASNLGIFDVTGIDGDPNVSGPNVITHDFRNPYNQPPVRNYDLGWATEFVEHVEEEYIPNYMGVLVRCRYAVITYAPPGHGGHHHVNEQPEEYWLSVFEEYGFRINWSTTEEMRERSTMNIDKPEKKQFMRLRGLFFERYS